MAGVYIKGMEMPKNCWECMFEKVTSSYADGLYGVCSITNKHIDDGQEDWCPLVPVPDHGDLIEKPILIDELAISEEPDDCRGCASYNSYDDFCCRSLDFQTMCRSIRTAPVVIPVDKN